MRAELCTRHIFRVTTCNIRKGLSGRIIISHFYLHPPPPPLNLGPGEGAAVLGKYFNYFFITHRGPGFYYIIYTVFQCDCRPSDYTVGRRRAEIRTQDGRPKGRNTTPPSYHHTSFKTSRLL